MIQLIGLFWLKAAFQNNQKYALGLLSKSVSKAALKMKSNFKSLGCYLILLTKDAGYLTWNLLAAKEMLWALLQP